MLLTYLRAIVYLLLALELFTLGSGRKEKSFKLMEYSLALAFVGSVVSVVLTFVDATWRQEFVDYGLTTLFGFAALMVIVNLWAMRRRL